MATESLAKADELGFQWRDSAAVLERARETAADGDLDAALVLAERARFEGDAAQAQARREADASPRF